MRVRYLAGMLFLALVAISGCGSASPVAAYPVRGQVLLGDQPVGGAQVVFHPETSFPPTVPKPTGITESDGSFKLTTFGDYDGAPVGKYRVTVEWRDWRMVGEEKVRQGRALLPGRYLLPETSGLSCTVEARENQLEVLRVKTK